MKHEDGRITTVLVHKNDPLPKGLLRKILREDLKISVEELKSYISSYIYNFKITFHRHKYFPPAQRLPDSSGKPGEALRQAQCDRAAQALCRTCSEPAYRQANSRNQS